MTLTGIEFIRLRKAEIGEVILSECANLFSEHYGLWSYTAAQKNRRGKRITRTANDILTEYLPGENAWMATARHENQLIGYATAIQSKLSHGFVSWVTQLVVHTNYQNSLVGSIMLKSIWGYSMHYAWGIASANPFAVRALEKATRRRCEPVYMCNRLRTVKRVIAEVPYLRDKEILIKPTLSKIDTKFFQDLSSIDKRIMAASQKSSWIMGSLNEGEEWLAATFNEQEKTPWTDNEYKEFQQMADSLVRTAYDRMAAANPVESHPWAKPEYAQKEVEYLVKAMGMSVGASILDFGCGSGRHVAALAEQGFNVTGVESSSVFIHQARELALNGAQFLEDDCRNVRLPKIFDFGICLYDVIGSYPDDESNQKILNNLVSHIKPGGCVAFSVMSFDYIESRAQNRAAIVTADMLDALPSSETMQTTGEVFNPNFLILETKTKVVYRKETFDRGVALPMELIVRDRRYSFDDLKEMCKRAGLKILHMGYVKAGQFNLVEQVTNTPTKEVLVVAEKQLV